MVMVAKLFVVGHLSRYGYFYLLRPFARAAEVGSGRQREKAAGGGLDRAARVKPKLLGGEPAVGRAGLDSDIGSWIRISLSNSEILRESAIAVPANEVLIARRRLARLGMWRSTGP